MCAENIFSNLNNEQMRSMLTMDIEITAKFKIIMRLNMMNRV